MNYNKESLRNALAAEYVLGTLRGGARRRFQQLIMSSQAIAESTWMWEQYLNGMGEDVAPIKPDESVWLNIQSQLGFADTGAKVTHLDTVRDASASRWRAPIVAALAASIFMAVLFTSIPSQVPVSAPITHVAVVNDTETNPLWLIEVSDDRLRVRATDQLIATASNDFELWIVPANGNAPISLGVLPQDGELNVPAPDSLKSVPIMVLAVSLEPVGGSPNGQPTEVLYTSNLITV